MQKYYHNTKEDAVKHAASLLTKGDWLQEDSVRCACGESLAIRLRDADIGKVRAMFIVCEACRVQEEAFEGLQERGQNEL